MEHWQVTATPLGIVVTARGHDRAQAFEAAIASFHEIAGKREGSFKLIGDLRQMTGYDSDARVAWQKALYQHRKRIEAIVLIGGSSPLIRMGAAAVGAFTGIPLRFVSSWNELTGATRAGGVNS